MTTTLIEGIQKNLGYPELHKIDPNTQEVKSDGGELPQNDFGQAAIPAVLIGLYRYANTEKGSAEILNADLSSDWLNLFFTDKKGQIIEKVASYSGKTDEAVAQSMEEIADEAIRVIREQTHDNASFTDVKSYVAQQRTSILTYLPADLQLSIVLDDNTLDDRTNKMEGPISNSMHFIEKLFSGSNTEKNETVGDEKKIG